jgi:translation machinery-associated protein 16
MPSKLTKIQKLVTKKKGKSSRALHENSRDALRIRKASIRDDRVSKDHKVRKGANEQWVNRVAWFKDRLPDTLHPYTKEELVAAAEEYLTHMDEEINQLQSERRAGRPATTRHQLLELAKDGVQKEFVSGLWMPNLQDEQTLIKLDAWQYDWLSLSNMGFVRVDAEGLVKEAQFPPNKAA